MRYSEAIRLGGMLQQKSRFVFFCKETPITSAGVCVQGAALNAIGKLDKTKSNKHIAHWHAMDKEFPWAMSAWVGRDDVPSVLQNKWSSYRLQNITINLNDVTDWTRERIADWVARMEVKYGDPQIHNEVVHESIEEDICLNPVLT